MSLYIIVKKSYIGEMKDVYDEKINVEDPFIFYNLNDALNELRRIYSATPNLMYDSYHIKVYQKQYQKFILTHHTYYHQK
jgi:hypothetical protein